MQFHKHACSFMSLHAVLWPCMQLPSSSEQLTRISQCLLILKPSNFKLQTFQTFNILSLLEKNYICNQKYIFSFLFPGPFLCCFTPTLASWFTQSPSGSLSHWLSGGLSFSIDTVLNMRILWRFIMIKFPTKAVQVCTLARCRIVLIAGFGRICTHVLL